MARPAKGTRIVPARFFFVPDLRSCSVFDSVFAKLNRPVWVITAATPARRGGLLATWVFQASIDPESPTLIIGLAPNHFTTELVDEAGGFAAHLLRRDQVALALDFALGSGRDRDKLATLAPQPGAAGAPVLPDCVAVLECQVYARLDAGDRIYFWSDVVSGGSRSDAAPLTEEELVAGASPSQRSALAENRDHDRRVLAAGGAAWRADLPEGLRFAPRRP